MTRLRYDNALGMLGASLAASAGPDTITFEEIPVFATLAGGDYIPLVLDPPENAPSDTFEIAWLTAYTAGELTGTITRAQEGTSSQTHGAGEPWTCAPTTADFADDDSGGGGGSGAFQGVVVDNIINSIGYAIPQRSSADVDNFILTRVLNDPSHEEVAGNPTGWFDTSTGLFTPTVDGWYRVRAWLELTVASTAELAIGFAGSFLSDSPDAGHRSFVGPSPKGTLVVAEMVFELGGSGFSDGSSFAMCAAIAASGITAFWGFQAVLLGT